MCRDGCRTDAEDIGSCWYMAAALSGRMVFISAWFIGNHQNETARGFARAPLQTILAGYEKLMAHPDDLKARGNIMWASCVNTVGTFRCVPEALAPEDFGEFSQEELYRIILACDTQNSDKEEPV